ncbi:unnamed protein product [Dicrocoelium dendriticum]|nr:unnamed protein product [Dicrocoelium dendriticum]
MMRPAAEEYTRRQLGAEASGSGMLKTILTVVGCAVAYLGLIIALTVFCSMRMVRARRKRSPKALKIHENGQLLTPGGEPNGAGGMNGTPQNSACGPGNAFDSGLHMTGAGSGVSGSGATSFGHVYAHHTPTLLSSNTTAMRNGVFYAEGENLRNTGTHASITPTGLGAACLQAPSGAPQDSHDWRSWNTHGYFCPSEQQSKVPHGTPAGPLELTSESNTESVGVQSHGHMRTHPLHSTPCGYPYTHRTSGADNSTNTTTASEPLLMSAPPPTPLDSRSHFSGISSGNSTSLYSRSLLSGASNTGLQAGGASHGAQTNGDVYGPASISQADRMHYPRSELQIEGILGKGIFGDIFLARARNIQEDESQSLVLVKSLASHESTHINEFHRQLELFGKLNHEHVTRLLGICMEQEPFYMLLEYCEWVRESK